MTRPVSIKICGLADKRAVAAVVTAKADYAGFVYFPASPRHVTFERAATLKSLLPSSTYSVSVMVDPDDTLLEQAHSILQPNYVQLHGKETPERIKAIKKIFPGIKIIKAISVRNGDDVAQAAAYEAVDMLMFDAKPPESSFLSPPLAGGQGGNISTPQNIGYFGALPNTTRNSKAMKHAKSMRQLMTDAEWKLWKYLSGKQLGYKFRRQQTIGNYIVDFVCMDKQLVIEIDGGQHAEQQKEYDIQRTAFLENAGYRVLRFWNNEALENTEGVIETILAALHVDSPPSPPASGGAKKEWLPGGNALSFDWALLKGREFPKPWFLSGGLNANNVAEAIRISGAKMVDVSSGVESAPGVKDAALIRSFVKAVRYET